MTLGPKEENVAESNKPERPRPVDVSPDQGPGELEDLDTADADVKGGGVSSGAGGTGPDEIRSQ